MVSSAVLLLLAITSVYVLVVCARGNPPLLSEALLTERQEDETNSNELIFVDPASLGVRSHYQEQKIRRTFVERACDCMTTTGRCMSYGSYQCYFAGGASIVQCVGGNKWVKIGSCPSSCRTWGNDQPYCT